MVIYQNKLTEALAIYSENRLPQITNPQYEEILKSFPFACGLSMASTRERAYTAFKRHDFTGTLKELGFIRQQVII